MFDQIDPPRPIRRPWAVCLAVMGAFCVGFEFGILWAGLKPFDWPMAVLELLFTMGLTVWFAIKAATGPWKMGGLALLSI